MGNPVLVLDALVPDRPYVTIKSARHPEGRNYELRNFNELSLEQLKTVEVLGLKANALIAEDIDTADAAMLDDWLVTMMRLVFYTELEDDVLASLDPTQRMAIIGTFTEVCLKPNARARQTLKKSALSGAK